MKNMKNLKWFTMALVLSVTGLASCGGGNSQSEDIRSSVSQSSGGGAIDSSWVVPDTGKQMNDPRDYSTADYKTKSAILATLERYALRNHTAGIPLYDDASYEQFSQRVTASIRKTYLTNYGFGTGYGSIDGEMMYNGNIVEANPEWRSYFHGYTTADSGTFNGWNATGSDVSDRMSMVTTGYYSVQENKTGDGWEWIPDLATDAAPIMLDSMGGNPVAGNGESYKDPATGEMVVPTSQFWRVKLHYGAGYTYRVPEQSKRHATYDGREIALEDYLVPFKAMLDNRYTRASTLITDSTGFVGASSYYYSQSHTSWPKDIGIQINEAEGSLDFAFIEPKSVESARTNLSSGLFSPVPEAFLNDVGIQNYNMISNVTTPTDSGFDNVLVMGAYIPTYYQNGKEIVYKKNDTYHARDLYHYAGYTEVVYNNDTGNAEEAAYNDFLENKLDEATIPVKQIKNHKNDPTVRRTEGSTIIKLNLNTTTEEEWEYYFGTNGTISKHAAQKYWATQAIMSNDDFLNGLFVGIDRQSLAADAGRNPAVGYLSGAYIMDPAGIEYYRNSKWGKWAQSYYTELAGNEFAYNEALATSFFKRAGKTLIAQGYAYEGQEIRLQVKYRYQSTIDDLGKYIEDQIERLWNAANEEIHVTLNLELKVAGSQYTDCYNLMDNGEFDMGEGAISGNVLDPLSFMNTCSSTKALNQGFNLNWGSDTAKVLPERVIYDDAGNPTGKTSYTGIVYEGRRWSFDALWNASQSYTPVKNGVATPIADNQRLSQYAKDDESGSVDPTYLYFRADYPANAVDDQGVSLYTFSAVDIALLVSETNSAGTAGWYMTDANFSVVNDGVNGYVQLKMKRATIQKYLNQGSTSSAMKYFTVYFSLVYKMKKEGNTITKAVQIASTYKATDYGLKDGVVSAGE